MALANAVEVRYPFLDASVAELACRLPSRFKIRGLTEKYLLRQLAGQELPSSLASREKFAFTAPGGTELLAAGGDLVEHLLAPNTIRKQGFFDPREVERLKALYARPGYRLNVPFERDTLLLIATFSMFIEVFDVSHA